MPRQCLDERLGASRRLQSHNRNRPEPCAMPNKQLETLHHQFVANLCLPTMPENSLSLLATSAGCSMKFVVESMTPGTSTWTSDVKDTSKCTCLVFRDGVLHLSEDIHLDKADKTNQSSEASPHARAWGWRTRTAERWVAQTSPPVFSNSQSKLSGCDLEYLGNVYIMVVWAVPVAPAQVHPYLQCHGADVTVQIRPLTLSWARPAVAALIAATLISAIRRNSASDNLGKFFDVPTCFF